MTTAKILTSFASGEISPTLWGRTDLAKFHVGAATIRNMYVDYRGGVTSRGGLAFVGASKTAGTSLPPRLIPFTFNVQLGQTYILEFGNKYIRFIQNGAYILETAKVITNVSLSNPVTITSTAHGFSNGDWVYLSGITGTTRLNGKTAIVNVLSADQFALTDLFGNPISSLGMGAFGGVGYVARVYTLASPYLIADLPYLKFDQSADVMTLTHAGYAPYDLKRYASNNWTLTQQSFTTVISPPATVTAWANQGTSGTTQYKYCVTAIDFATGQESVASAIAYATSINIATTAGSMSIQWSAVPGASSYRVYKAPTSIGTSGIPGGIQFGYMASTTGVSCVDSNILPDYTTSPPIHRNPFAISPVNYVTVTAGGSGYAQATTTATISSSTGTGAILEVNVGTTAATSGEAAGAPLATGSIQSITVINGGEGYKSTDTVVISGAGANATATMTVGPATGTWPGVISYFQQRRVYAATWNQPNTYFMSKPGAFLNFDKSSPTIANDAIEGTPWSKQINGVSWMVPMPGGLVVLAGLGAWQVSGGGNAAPITPASQTAQPQAYNGVSPTVQPIVINYDILYVQQKGNQVLDLAYNFFTNIYTGQDITIMSSHLFKKTIKEWAWAQSPHKLVWAVRTDGMLLSLTFLKEQEVQGWARHDTNGLFKSVAVVSEGVNDGAYFVVQRFVNGQWVYYIERMDDRTWDSIDDVFAVDSGLRNNLVEPDAVLTAASATGTSVSFMTSTAAFSAANIGDVIRVGGGMATVTSFVSSTEVLANITVDILITLPDDPTNTPLPAQPGDWTISTPITTLYGIEHLEGKTVAILADGSVSADQTVVDGSITLPHTASSIVVGLPYTVQAQSLYTDIEGAATVQGKRKNIPGVTLRVSKSRGFKVGANQVDTSTQETAAITSWQDLIEVKERDANIYAGSAVPLYTGDRFLRINPDWATPGQVSVQQDYPLPLSISAIIPELTIGDDNG